MRVADWRITIDGREVEKRRMVSLSTTDNRGLEVDQLTVEFSDQDGLLALPQKGVALELAIGYYGEDLVDRGTFVVDCVKHTGPPDMVVVTAKSARMSHKNGADNVRTEVGQGDKLKVGKERSWADITLGDMIEQIAAAHQLQPRVSPALAGYYFKQIDQTESAAHFLTRIAEDLDAVATVKAGRLLFLEAGKAQNADGQAVERIVIKRKDGDRHNFEAAEKGRFTGCSAHWHDHATGRRNRVDVGAEGYRKRLQRTYPSEAEAMKAAQSEHGRLSRGLATIELDIADPDPYLFAETPAELRGWHKPEIDHDRWVITKVTLTIDPNAGMTASLDAEERPPE